MKRILPIFLIFMLIPGLALAGNLPKKGELGDTSWYVKEMGDKVFYFTHGTAVWGHEFGFYRYPDDYANDVFLLILTSYDEKVKEFVGKEAVILLSIDGKDV